MMNEKHDIPSPAETGTCDACGQPSRSFHNPVNQLLLCPNCFQKKMKRYYAKHGNVPVGNKELKELFARRKKKDKKLSQETLF